MTLRTDIFLYTEKLSYLESGDVGSLRHIIIVVAGIPLIIFSQRFSYLRDGESFENLSIL